MSPAQNKNEILNMKRVTWMTGQRHSHRTRRGNTGRYHAVIPRKYKFHSTEGINLCSGGNFSFKVCPNVNQVVLAFTTLLFFASFECLLITILTVGPGIQSRGFTHTNCTVVNTLYNGNSSCYVTTLQNHGAVNFFPCLQIYVTPGASPFQSTASNRTKRSLPAESDQTQRARDENAAIPRWRRAVSSTAPTNTTTLLLYQNELNFAGDDYLYRRCSYLPTNCPRDQESTLSGIAEQARRYGRINSTYTCYHDAEKGRVMLQRLITEQAMFYSVLWPICGMAVSALGCATFWKRNFKRMSRLFIYNSWSAS